MTPNVNNYTQRYAKERGRMPCGGTGQRARFTPFTTEIAGGGNNTQKMVVKRGKILYNVIAGGESRFVHGGVTPVH